MKNATCEKLLGVKNDQHLNFNDHVKPICKKASGKLRALARVTPYMCVEKRKLIMNSFFNTQFNDKRSCYEDLLAKDKSVSIHHKNIQDVAIEMFKVKNRLAPKIVNDLFYNETENHYNLRHRTEFRILFVNSIYHGSESISCLGSKIWDIVPSYCS